MIEIQLDSGDAATYVPALQLVRISDLPPPANISARSGKRAIYLSWDRVPTADGYEIYRSTNSSSGFLPIAGTGNRTYSDSDLTAETQNYYYLVATNDFYTSAASSVVSAKPFSVGPNSPPILNYVNPIRLTPTNGSFRIPFASLLKSSDAHDMDGNAVTFKIESVLNGVVYTNGTLVNTASGDCPFDANTIAVWIPASTVPEAGLEAFKVTAFDGFLRSSPPVPVTIVPVT